VRSPTPPVPQHGAEAGDVQADRALACRPSLAVWPPSSAPRYYLRGLTPTEVANDPSMLLSFERPAPAR